MSEQYGSSWPPAGAPGPYRAGPAPSPYDPHARPSPYAPPPRPSPYDAPPSPVPDVQAPPDPAGPRDDDGPEYDGGPEYDDAPPSRRRARRERADRTARTGRATRPVRRGPRLPRVPRGVAVSATVLAAIAAARGSDMVQKGNAAPGDGVTELTATVGEAARGTSVDAGTLAEQQRSRTSAAPVLLPKGLDVEHLLSRVTFGATDALRNEVRTQGAAAWLARQLEPMSLPDPGGGAVTALFPRLRLTPAQIEANVTDQWEFQCELAAAHLGLAIWSSRQLFEMMVAFWSDHFAIPCPGDRAVLTRHLFDSDVIRRGALGRFEDLLQASAIHPAMLEFFDNDVSTPDRPNENYARVLLEHHTVGVFGDITDQDVRQASLLLTGFQIKDHVPRFVPLQHSTGAVDILDFSHPNDSAKGGRDAAASFLHHLATHPATADHLARKLAVRFVSDDPPEALLRRLARTYLDNDTRIVPVLTALLSSPEFAASKGRKLRRPLERLTATVRALGIGPGKDAEALLELHSMLARAGQAPLGHPGPEGYPDVASAWQSPAAALEHFSASAGLAHGWWPKGLSNPCPAALARSGPTTGAAVIDAVASRLLRRAPTPAERTAATGLLSAAKLPASLPAGGREQKEAIGLVATLLLNSPSYVMR